MVTAHGLVLFEFALSLEGERLIKSMRGQVLVMSRKGLERKARDFYGVPEAEYRLLSAKN